MSNDQEIVRNNAGGSDSDDEKRAAEYLCNSSGFGFMNAAMRRKLLQSMVKMLPDKMQNRITALKNLQLQQMNIESEFYDEMYQLEKKYLSRYQQLYDKRKDIICGDYEPSENEEQQWKSDTDDETEMTEKMKEVTIKFKKDLESKYHENDKGIPDFWLTIFRSTEILSDMIQKHDEAVFKKLQDIKMVYTDSPPSYILEFHFDKNPYFSNPILTKQYFLKHKIDEEHPWSFEGPEINKCIGCTINWEKAMNLTIKTIRKKQKHKERGAVRTIIKQVPNDSFFNFFNPPEISDDKDKVDEDSQEILATDFEIGHLLRSRIIPRAVLFYTGDIVEDEEDYDEEEEDDEEEDDEDYDADDDEGNTVGGEHKKNVKKATPNDCPNQ